VNLISCDEAIDKSSTKLNSILHVFQAE